MKLRTYVMFLAATMVADYLLFPPAPHRTTAVMVGEYFGRLIRDNVFFCGPITLIVLVIKKRRAQP